MDKKMKRFGFTALLILTLCCSRSTWAVLSSSYYDGRVYYNEQEEGIAGWIDFAVYDTHAVGTDIELQANKIDESLFPDQDQYIYAYQIFQYSNVALDVTEFSVLDSGRNLLDESLINNTSAQDDEAGGISPTISDIQGVWTWSLDGSGYISAGEHSWLLVFSSDQNLTKGTYDIKGSGIPAPVPEPTTIALLALGSLIFTSRHRRRSRV